MESDRIISIETSSRRGSAALAVGPLLVAESEFSADAEHARDLLPQVHALCKQQAWNPSDIDQCYLSIGPGSFTGLRVAVTFARHLALATGARIVAVPTLDVIAENCIHCTDPPARLAVILDAKRNQVFAATYAFNQARYELQTGPVMTELAELLARDPGSIAIVGEGIDYHRESCKASGAKLLDRDCWLPRAANVHRIGFQMAADGRFTDPTQLVPFYLRRPEAEEIGEKRRRPDAEST